ncbi:MAG TPA: hypothetical protein PLD88_08255, partial [Candidatus Berkiella sp.]|nr:hypothetical protein [Candidatus Berkiella sp.]
MGDQVTILLVNKNLPSNRTNKNPSYVILDNNYYRYKETLVPGLITDFLITAKAINDYHDQFSDIQLKNREKYVTLTAEQGCFATNESLLQYLVREQRFSDKYKYDLKNTLESLLKKQKEKIKSCTSTPEAKGYLIAINWELFKNPQKNFLYQKPIAAPEPHYPQDAEKLLINAIEKIANNQKAKIVPFSAEEKKFSSNPELGKIYLEPIKNDTPNYFYKFMRQKDPFSILYEVNGLLNLKQLYQHIIEPVLVDPDYRFCIEPFFNGTPLALYFKNDFEKNAIFIYNIELRRAEEILTGYVNSLEEATKHSTIEQRIHKLYYDRLVGERIHSYYDKKVIELTTNESISFEELKKLAPIINGIEYPSLEEVIQKAKHNLNPEFLNKKLKIYGFGDNHAGNVLVKGNGEYVTIDYEYAGIAHPSIDLAKTIYNDVYFDILFPDTSATNFHVDVKLDREPHHIIITHNYTLSEA